MGKILYQLFIQLYSISIKIASPFNEKARLWKNGRVDLFSKMKAAMHANDQIVWMHCASLGEFEQGRPLLEKLRGHYPSHKILLTFFSPSGFQVRKNYEGANYIFYLPIDSEQNVKCFYDLWQPKLVIFVKYEFWFYYLNEAKNRQVPLLLISGIFRKNQQFFSSNGVFHRQMLTCFTHLFVQNQESVSLLATIGLTERVSLTGDTRFDRVIEIAESFTPISTIERFCANSKVVVAGSTWLEDDRELAHFVNSRSDIKFIIAPHNTGKSRLEDCKKLYKKSAFFSAFESGIAGDINTIIIDNVGMLSKLYKYATITFIGGGFGKGGIHNVLEAAVYGKPVIHGPEYKKYFEAIELVQSGGASSVNNGSELEKVFDELLNDNHRVSQMSKASEEYVYSKRGSTEKIIKYIYKNRLLTK